MSNIAFLIMPIAIDIALTVGCFLCLELLSRGRWPLVTAFASSPFVPVLLILLAVWFLFLPNPHHYDGPGMGFAASAMFAVFAIPIGAASSAVAFMLARRRRLKTSGAR